MVANDSGARARRWRSRRQIWTAADDEPPLDRHATLSFIEEIRRWAGKAVER
jgi:hypothetical protein